MTIGAVFGCVPREVRDNLADLTALTDAARAAAIVRATGFETRRVAAPGRTLLDYALPACAAALEGVAASEVGGLVTVSFSRERRFPALAAQLQRALGLGTGTAGLDLSMACSGYPYGLFTADRLAVALGKPVLLVHGDLQSRFTDPKDAATLAVMSDAVTATLVRPEGPEAAYAFHTDGSGADVLTCGETIAMDGFGVYRFVAGPVRAFLADFLAARRAEGREPDVFVPHQANLYMVRQLADALGLADRLHTCGADYGNPGGASVPLALATGARNGCVLAAGFGAGLSAAAACFAWNASRHGVQVVM